MVLCSAAMCLAEGAPTPFEQKLSLLGITFQVETSASGNMRELVVTPGGLEKDNYPIRLALTGTIRGAEIGDINSDGSPELYVYVTLPGPGKRVELLAWSANNKKSLSAIHLPELPADDPKLKGYRGHDEFAVVEGIVARRFPIYKQTDSDDKPTGGMRQFQYKLKAGEALWILSLDKSVEF